MKIVHLSDLHYGLWKFDDELESTHYFKDDETGRPQPKDLADILLSSPPAQAPDVVVVSGDLGWSGVKQDYTFAIRFLNQLRKKWSSSRFVINAGNHDVNLKESKNELRQDAFVAMLKRFHGTEFSRLFPCFDAASTGQKRSLLVSVDYLPSEALFVSVNSAATINDPKKDAILIIPAVFKAITSTVEKLNVDKDVLRVFVLHHHLLPFAEPTWSNTSDVKKVVDRPDRTTVANSARLQSWLASNGFHLVLHGHKHTFHGREDVLWRYASKNEENKIVVLGAGSAGVTRREMGHQDPHSFNIVNCERLQSSRWDLQIQTLGITSKEVVHGVSDSFEHRTSVGVPPAHAPFVFQADDMQMCHRAIKSTLEKEAVVTNFMSIVEDSRYQCLETSRIGNQETTEEDIQRSFQALHPEWDVDKQWSDTKQLDFFLRRLPETYRIQHGPRLFGRNGLATHGPASTDGIRPIQFAYDSLNESGSQAYVGLYNSNRDIGSDLEPLPGLVGIQFIKGEAGRLDIVMTFRNIELSFWWEVNMLEGRRLLDWACKGGKFTPGRVTFYAALAEWRFDPRPMFVSKIDEMKREELFALVLFSSMGHRDYTRILAEKLENKRQETSSLNIHFSTLEDLLFLVNGILSVPRQDRPGDGKSPICSRLGEQLKEVVARMRNAVMSRATREDEIDLARSKLKSIVASLERFAATRK